MPLLQIETEFEIKDIIYLKTDTKQEPGIVTKIQIDCSGLYYFVGFGMEESMHYGFEMSKEKNIEMI